MAMDFCLRDNVREPGLVFKEIQVLEDSDEEEKTWGHRRCRAKLIFKPTGIVLGKFLRLCCDLDPFNPGNGHRSGWQAQYRVLASGGLQIFDFADLAPGESDFSEFPLQPKEQRGSQMTRRYVGSGDEPSRLEAAKAIMQAEHDYLSVFHEMDYDVLMSTHGNERERKRYKRVLAACLVVG
ncbi:unnamed protein product [Symbiodinium sp. CCMP2592]|nr:unnamed protein product [Symbiodinium sp. CCMP2592]